MAPGSDVSWMVSLSCLRSPTSPPTSLPDDVTRVGLQPTASPTVHTTTTTFGLSALMADDHKVLV